MRALLVDAAIVVLAASAPVAIEALRGLDHAASDLTWMFIPHYAWWWSRARWAGGWNPWIFGGFPSNADPLVGHLHPLGLLWAAFPPLAASALEGAAAPALAGLGMLLYLRRIGCGRTGSLVGALSFACGGYVHAHATHPEKLRSVLALPWALWAIESFQGLGLVAALGAATALLVAGGHPQTIVQVLVLVVAYALLFARRRRGAAAAGLALGALVPAATWLPAIQLGLRSTHLHTVVPHLDRLGAACAHTLVVPFACGGGGAVYGAAVERFAGCGLVECAGYPGMLVWLAVLAGLPRILRTRRGRFWLVVAVAGLVLATGLVESVFVVPGVRAPSRALLWWNLAGAAAAAMAIGSVRAPGASAVRWRGGWLAATLALALVVLWSATRGPVARRASLVSLGVLAATAAVARRPRSGLLVAVLAADLLVFGAELHAGAPPRLVEGIRAGLGRVRDALRTLPGPEAQLGRALAVPSFPGAMWAAVEGVPFLQGWDVLVPGSFTRLLSGEGAPFAYEVGWVGKDALGPENRVLDVLRCRLVLLPLELADDPAVAHARWRPLGEMARWRLYANARALPVAWLVGRVRVVPDDEALRLVRGEGGTFDPASEALASTPIPGLGSAASGTVRVVAYDDDAIALHADTPAAALLVTSELASPGWRASVDGAAAEIHTVDAGLRAVVVPAGSHEVAFRYRPRAGMVGLGAGGAALLALVACAVQAGRRRNGLDSGRRRG